MKSGIDVRAEVPHPVYADQVLFVHWDSASDINYGADELDGFGQWIVAVFVKFSGSEETAETELEKLCWSLLSLFAQNAQTDNWRSLVVVSIAKDYLAGAGGSWYIGARFNLRVRWTLTW